MVSWSGGCMFAVAIRWHQTSTNHNFFVVGRDGNTWVNKYVYRINNG